MSLWEFPEPSPEMKRLHEQFRAKLREAVAAYNALSPEQKTAHDRAQRASYIRSFMAGDFESRR